MPVVFFSAVEELLKVPNHQILDTIPLVLLTWHLKLAAQWANNCITAQQFPIATKYFFLVLYEFIYVLLCVCLYTCLFVFACVCFHSNIVRALRLNGHCALWIYMNVYMCESIVHKWMLLHTNLHLILQLSELLLLSFVFLMYPFFILICFAGTTWPSGSKGRTSECFDYIRKVWAD